MFCQKCGAENKEGTNFCENCGTSFAAPVAEQPVARQPLYQQPVAPPPPVAPPQQYVPPQYVAPYAPPAPVKKKKKTGLIVILAVLAVLVLGVVAIFAVFIFSDSEIDSDLGSEAEDAAIGFVEAVSDYDYDKMEEYSFIKIEEYFEFQQGVSLDELKDRFENAKEYIYLGMAEQFGEDAITTVTVTGSEVLSGDDAETAVSLLNLDKYFFKGDIKSVTKVHLLLEIKGDLDENSTALDLYVAQSDSGWSVLNGLEYILDIPIIESYVE